MNDLHQVLSLNLITQINQKALKRVNNLRIMKTEIEAATRGVPCKKVFLEISQNSQENTCARVSFLIKLQA